MTDKIYTGKRSKYHDIFLEENLLLRNGLKGFKELQKRFDDVCWGADSQKNIHYCRGYLNALIDIKRLSKKEADQLMIIIQKGCDQWMKYVSSDEDVHYEVYGYL